MTTADIPAIEAAPDEIRYLGDMHRLVPQRGEVFVLTTGAQVLSAEQRERILEYWKAVMPENKLLVLDGGFKLGVIAPE